MDILKYKEYEGTAELDMVRGVCRGKILFINDVVTYEAALPAKLKNEFEAAVDDYIETCKTLGREPQKPLKGQFNVRIPPDLHKDAVLQALAKNVYLNDLVVSALDAYLHGRGDVNHVENKNYFVVTDQLQSVSLAGNQSGHVIVYGEGNVVTAAVTSVLNAPVASPTRGGRDATTHH